MNKKVSKESQGRFFHVQNLVRCLQGEAIFKQFNALVEVTIYNKKPTMLRSERKTSLVPFGINVKNARLANLVIKLASYQSLQNF